MQALRTAIKSADAAARPDTIILPGMTVAEIEARIGLPDSSFWTKDSVLIYLYYNSAQGPSSSRTPFILFNRWKQQYFSSMETGLYLDNSGPTVDRSLDTEIHHETAVLQDTAALFTFNIYMSGYEDVWLRQVDGKIYVSRFTRSRVDSIQVHKKKDGSYVQTILVPENDNRISPHSPLTFEDLNFDGQDDISLTQSNSSANITNLYWLYNPTTGQFEAAEDLSDITTAQFNEDKEEVTSAWRDGCCHHGVSTYKYVNGKPVLVAETDEQLAPEGDSLIHTEYRLVNGTLKQVLQKKVLDSEL